MQLRQGITPQYLLKALHTGGNFASNRGRRVDVNVQKAMREKVQTLLCRYVDQWLKTGFDKKNQELEAPGNRRVQDIEDPEGMKTAYAAAQEYCQKFPPMVIPHEGLPAIFGFQIADHWNEGVGIDDAASLLTDAEDEAARIFTLLLAADWRDRLYKCKRCGEYGLLRRKPIAQYKRGIHCKKCRHKATAVRSRSDQLRALQKERIKAASKAWRSWTPRKGDRKQWVLSQVNYARGSKDDPIKITWVSRWLNGTLQNKRG